jgi:hypothetical protein
MKHYFRSSTEEDIFWYALNRALNYDFLDRLNKFVEFYLEKIENAGCDFDYETCRMFASRLINSH